MTDLQEIMNATSIPAGLQFDNYENRCTLPENGTNVRFEPANTISGIDERRNATQEVQHGFDNLNQTVVSRILETSNENSFPQHIMNALSIGRTDAATAITSMQVTPVARAAAVVTNANSDITEETTVLPPAALSSVVRNDFNFVNAGNNRIRQTQNNFSHRISDTHESFPRNNLSNHGTLMTQRNHEQRGDNYTDNIPSLRDPAVVRYLYSNEQAPGFHLERTSTSPRSPISNIPLNVEQNNMSLLEFEGEHRPQLHLQPRLENEVSEQARHSHDPVFLPLSNETNNSHGISNHIIEEQSQSISNIAGFERNYAENERDLDINSHRDDNLPILFDAGRNDQIPRLHAHDRQLRRSERSDNQLQRESNHEVTNRQIFFRDYPKAQSNSNSYNGHITAPRSDAHNNEIYNTSLPATVEASNSTATKLLRQENTGNNKHCYTQETMSEEALLGQLKQKLDILFLRKQIRFMYGDQNDEHSQQEFSDFQQLLKQKSFTSTHMNMILLLMRKHAASKCGAINFLGAVIVDVVKDIGLAKILGPHLVAKFTHDLNVLLSNSSNELFFVSDVLSADDEKLREIASSQGDQWTHVAQFAVSFALGIACKLVARNVTEAVEKDKASKRYHTNSNENHLKRKFSRNIDKSSDRQTLFAHSPLPPASEIDSVSISDQDINSPIYILPETREIESQFIPIDNRVKSIDYSPSPGGTILNGELTSRPQGLTPVEQQNFEDEENDNKVQSVIERSPNERGQYSNPYDNVHSNNFNTANHEEHPRNSYMKERSDHQINNAVTGHNNNGNRDEEMQVDVMYNDKSKSKNEYMLAHHGTHKKTYNISFEQSGEQDDDDYISNYSQPNSP